MAVVVIHRGARSSLSLFYAREIILYSGRYDFPCAATHGLILSVYSFILAPAAMRNAQKCSLLGSTLVEGNVYFYQPRNGSI